MHTMQTATVLSPMTSRPAGAASSGSTVLSPRVRNPAGLKAVEAIPMSRYTWGWGRDVVRHPQRVITAQWFGWMMSLHPSIVEALIAAVMLMVPPPGP